MPNLTGKMLGKVRVDMFLARGGMADVFIGTHTTLHRAVAIKFLKGDLQDDPDLRERFEREARVIAMLRHPNIVQVHDFDTYENQPYLVMEYIPGTSLGAYLRDLHKSGLRLDLTQVNALLGKLADALKYAHDNDVIHRDIKPGNVLLNSSTTPVSAGKPLPTDVSPIITDFGLVRFTQSKSKTSTGTITGTPAYMSPEQARGDQVDSRTDVYSLGITVYEMLAGRVPFDSDSAMGLLHMQIYDPPPPIEGLSAEIREVINRALAKDPNERFQTPVDFADAFQDAISGKADATTLLFPSAAGKSITSPLQSTRIATTGNRFTNAIIIGIISLLVVASIFMISRTMAPTGNTQAQATATSISQEQNEVTNTPSDVGPAPTESEAEPVGLFRFQDGTAIADQVTFSSRTMSLPPEGSQYEAWLITDDGEHRISMGVIQFDSEERGSLTFVDNEGQNLITTYHGIEITLEPNPDNSPNPSNDIAFSATLPSSGYVHVRHLLSVFPSTPSQTALIRGLRTNAELIQSMGQEMLTSFEARDEADARLQAESMLNIIVGIQSEEHKDWNEDGTVDDPGDGFGLLLNGDNVGYIQGTFSHANLALTSPDASPNMLIHGEHVKVAATNISEWTPQLRDQLIAILEAPSGSPETGGMIREAVVLANQMLSGVDINGNENIEPIPGEGGALTAYDHSYYMADIVVFP
jgi:serine/threonine protein kinase